MKKIISFILILVLVMTLSACGKVDITMQEIYDSSKNETLLKNHQSVLLRDEVDGIFDLEGYLTKDYIYYYYADSNWAELLTDDAYYDYFDGVFWRVLALSPDGVSDIKSFREEYFSALLLAEDTVYETIESVSKKDGRITVKTYFDQEALENRVEDEHLTSGKYEYVLDSKSREIISFSGDLEYDDGTAYHMDSKVSYDAEAPEMAKALWEYVNQTEDLRNITIVTNPGTEKEISQSFQSPKGVLIGSYSASNFEETYGLYSDAACTESYEAYEDTDSDLTIYVEWYK